MSQDGPVKEGQLRVAIAGAGKVGRSVARELLDNGHKILLIEHLRRDHTQIRMLM